MIFQTLSTCQENKSSSRNSVRGQTVTTISQNDRNNWIPNVRPVFCVTHSLRIIISFHCSISQGKNVCTFVFLNWFWQNCYLPTNRAISPMRAVVSFCSELWRNSSFNQSIPCETYRIIKRLQSIHAVIINSKNIFKSFSLRGKNCFLFNAEMFKHFLHIRQAHALLSLCLLTLVHVLGIMK